MVAAILLASTFARLDYLERCPSPLVAVAPNQLRGAVVAPGGGTVTAVTPDGLSLRSCAYENHRVLEVTVQVAGAERVLVSVGQVVAAGRRYRRAAP
jgi:multidrug efflux pump subunit AcrA (membrane-fusion protein)